MEPFFMMNNKTTQKDNFSMRNVRNKGLNLKSKMIKEIQITGGSRRMIETAQ